MLYEHSESNTLDQVSLDPYRTHYVLVDSTDNAWGQEIQYNAQCLLQSTMLLFFNF